MFYLNEQGKKIHIINRRPRNLSGGGMIKPFKNHPVNHKDDTINSMLEYGDLVVPVPVMKSGVMNEYKGPITGKVQTDKSRLAKTIVMPDELVVHRKHAAKVEAFLRKKGITLPLGGK